MRSAALQTIRTSPSCPVVSAVALRCVAYFSLAPTSCSWTNPPTTWTQSLLIGWNASSRNTPAPLWRLLTTVTSLTMSPVGFLNSTVDVDSPSKATTPHGWSKSKHGSMLKTSRTTTVSALFNANSSGSRCRRRRVKQRARLVLLLTTSCMRRQWHPNADPTSWKSIFLQVHDLVTTSSMWRTFQRDSAIDFSLRTCRSLCHLQALWASSVPTVLVSQRCSQC